MSSGGERSAKVFNCSYLLQWYSFEKELYLLRGTHLNREDLRLRDSDAQTDGRSIAFNSFRSVLPGFEAVAKQSNVVSMGEVRDRYRGAHLHTGDVLKRFPEESVDDVVEQRRGKGTALADTRVDFK